MTFASPNALFLLLILLPIVWYIGFPRMAFRRSRDSASLVLRTALMLLIVLALAGLQVVRTVDRLAVVFLVDASDSMGAELQAAQVDFIRAAVTEKPIDDEWALIVFGADVSIDKPFNTINEVTPIRSTVLGNNTNLADALQTAISLFPADARRRIVVLSDGQETIGDAEAKARLAEASGVEISYVLFARQPQADVRISEFNAPARVAEGQDFDITVSVEAESATTATLLLFSGNELIQEESVSLQAGANRFSLTQSSPTGGFLNFSAQIVVPNSVDSYTQNNQLGTFSQIVGAPRVLLVASNPEDIAQLVPALEGAGVTIDTILPSNLPQDTSALATYESVIIVNVPASDISERQQSRLQTYVRELGGGLVFIGGANSYGPGGYFQTTLESMLPVETQIRDQQRLPQLTIAYLADSSGSMGVSVDGTFSNLDLEKRAISLSLDFLQPTDRAAILTFDSGGALVAPFQNVEDTQMLKEQLGTLRPGGGTDIRAGLQTAESYIINEPSELKHLILMTDGGANSTGLVEMTQRLHDDFGVTTSVIAIGAVIPPFLEQMADAGGGNFHRAGNVAQIPNILAQETVLATRSYIEEGDFTLRRTAQHPILDGLTAVPNLNGYVATTERATAQVILRSPEPNSDPILAAWQYGLGRVVAFTSDATSRWASNWVAWDAYPRFWTQALSYSITENAGNYIESRVVMLDERAQVIVDARNENGSFLNNLTLQTQVIAPDNTTQTLILQQTAPGRYEGSFLPTVEGAYFLGINGRGLVDGASRDFNEVTGWVMSYSPEYAINESNERLLMDIAAITGGQDIAANPAESFAVTTAPRTAVAPVWQYLIILAMILLPFDIALRRIIITRGDLQRLQVYLFGTRLGEGHEERMSSLRQARQRAREKHQSDDEAVSTVAALRRSRQRDNETVEPTSPSPTVPTPVNRPRPSASPETKRDSVNTVGSLLKRKKGDDDSTN